MSDSNYQKVWKIRKKHCVREEIAKRRRAPHREAPPRIAAASAAAAAAAACDGRATATATATPTTATTDMTFFVVTHR
jgi:hypothetical protein